MSYNHALRQLTNPNPFAMTKINQVQFSVAAYAAWAPDLVTSQKWLEWVESPFVISGSDEPPVPGMAPLLRRRAGFLGKMALEAAYQCLEGQAESQKTIPTVFCSRHGDVSRAMNLLIDVVKGEPVSPANFGLSVHNATAGLFSIACKNQSSHIALSAGECTTEYGVIEACGLLADGAAQVLLVSYDTSLPPLFTAYEDCKEQPHAWAWLMVSSEPNNVSNKAPSIIQLSWERAQDDQSSANSADAMPASLGVLKFYLQGTPRWERFAGGRKWQWSRHAS